MLQWHSRQFCASNFVATVWGRPFSCFSMTMPPCTKLGPYKNGLSIGVEELDWPAQSPDLNPIEHLWDEFESWLQARPECPTPVPYLTKALVAEWKQVPTAMFQHLVDNLPRRVEGGCYSSRMGGAMRCSTSKCPHTFDLVVYHKPMLSSLQALSAFEF